MRRVNHLHIRGSAIPGKFTEQVFPYAAPRPAYEAVIDRRRRAILGRAIGPAAAAFQYLHDATDDAAVVRPLDAPNICRQIRFDPLPLLIAQPKQVLAHDSNPPSQRESESYCQTERINEF